MIQRSASIMPVVAPTLAGIARLTALSSTQLTEDSAHELLEAVLEGVEQVAVCETSSSALQLALCQASSSLSRQGTALGRAADRDHQAELAEAFSMPEAPAFELVAPTLAGIGRLSGLTGPQLPEDSAQELLHVVLDAFELVAACAKSSLALQIAMQEAITRLGGESPQTPCKATLLDHGMLEDRADTSPKEHYITAPASPEIHAPSQEVEDSGEAALACAELASGSPRARQPGKFGEALSPAAGAATKLDQEPKKFPFGGPAPVEEDLDAWVDRRARERASHC